MKGSKRFVATTLIVLAIVGGTAAVGTHLIRQKNPNTRSQSEFTQEAVNRKQVYSEAFRNIHVEGAWDVEIRESDTSSTSLDVSKSVLEESRVEKQGDTLLLQLDGWTAITAGSAKVVVTTPELNEIKTEGGAEVAFYGFACRELTLDLKGACDLTGEESSIENLTVDAKGAVSIDLKRSSVKNAHVELSGAGEIEMVMDGGELTGSLEGVGTLSYSGTVSKEDVSTEGLSSVKKR
jgi:hypothetical protein